MPPLQALFYDTLAPYGASEAVRQPYWQELERAYTGKNRHYHNLQHLAHVWEELQGVAALMADQEAVIWALFYHDAVYKVRRRDNEAQSAALAVQRLRALGVSAERLQQVEALILATQGHAPGAHPDINYFTDADLAILGAPPERYRAYTRQIRSEYAIYPDFLYRPGRKKVLMAFLDMEYLYKTQHFRARYEALARENLRAELDDLQ